MYRVLRVDISLILDIDCVFPNDDVMMTHFNGRIDRVNVFFLFSVGVVWISLINNNNY